MPRVVRLLLKSVFPIFLLFLAMLVGWFLYPLDKQDWATLSQLHVQWDLQTSTLEQSVVVEKHIDCETVSIKKFMQPRLNNGDVLVAPIPLNGGLAAKIQALPIGTAIVFDRAMPKQRIAPGDYVMTIVALCQQPSSRLPEAPSGEPKPPLADPTSVPPSPVLLETDPVQALVTVPMIEVKPVPPNDRMLRP